MRRIFNVKKKIAPSSRALLADSGPLNMDESARSKMTISCRDADDLPKVKGAGEIVFEGKKKLQVMHNGTKVLAGGYYGEWMQEIITKLKGHHEPQEEKVFFEILKKIDSKTPTIIELGSFWAYYSLWFKSNFKNATAVCCEPDPINIKIGRENMNINSFTEGNSLIFVPSAAGSHDNEEVMIDTDSGVQVKAVVRSVDSIANELKLNSVDVLHIDVQGVELDALEGAKELIQNKKLRFLVVSTHHYVFSGDPLTHQKVIQFVEDNGGAVLAEHGILESYSGDGLVLASFDERDFNFSIELSRNHGPALFRPYEHDLATLMQAYDRRNEAM